MEGTKSQKLMPTACVITDGCTETGVAL